MTQIQSISCAERFADLNRTEWLVVARRPFHTDEWLYTWPAADNALWEDAKHDGSVLCVQRRDSREWVTLGRWRAGR